MTSVWRHDDVMSSRSDVSWRHAGVRCGSAGGPAEGTRIESAAETPIRWGPHCRLTGRAPGRQVRAGAATDHDQRPAACLSWGVRALAGGREQLEVGDAEAGVGLVAAVDRDEVGGECLDLAAVAEAAGVDAAEPGDPGRQRLYEVGRLPVVAEDQDVEVDLGDLGVEEEDG